ncbi:hypothetical protein DL764_005248 [Monosporascus ibericus]|uniref:Nucleolar 27S pre-rRNA processing Urb2/Npa2 C-terminal domain-containing protein n=1 Tax=Monosporascus ibericus TaxID=155417 RepID=A0A4Q4T9K4_9PEZI|nr:hypothetical protein DL764_005248 [Monosporascus ibericus]
MDAMDIDSHAHSGRTALIRAVRSLDENVDLTLSDQILNIWKLLSTSKATRLHSVEETILRWLFKQMTGVSQDAEQVRRYPLTWTVLHHAFLKIPPQALGRILADRKFTAILRQTLEDIYKSLRQSSTRAGGVSTTDTETQTKKRKRSSEIPSDIDQLRTSEGCMKTAVEIFGALAGLLAYGDRSVEAGSPEKKVGVEHIRSLFSSSTEETREITSKLLWICDSALSGLENGISREQKHWVGILSTLWNLHLHSKEDTYEFARHLYPPICSTIAKLKGLAASSPLLGSQATKDLWVRQLEQFLGAQFIRPARQRFAIEGSVEILKAALAIMASKPSASCNVMWDVAARTPRDLTDTTSKLEHASWAQNVFAALLEVLESAEETNRNGGVTQLLETALTTGSIPNTVTLREVCKAHALQAGHIDWHLLAKIVKCDSDVFLMDDTVLENLLDVITHSGRAPDLTDYIVMEVIIPLLGAYTRARDVSGFVKHWFKRLTSAGQASKQLDQSVWFDVRIRQHLANILQSALSETQLSRLLDWLDSEAENDGALLVVLDAICAGITQEEFIRSLDSRIFTMALQGKTHKSLPSVLAALRWRIAGYLASWENSDEICRLWDEVKPSLAGVLKASPLLDTETLEAFKCSCDLLLASHPEGKKEGELSKTVCSFMERLISALNSGNAILSLERYAEFTFRELPRLADVSTPDRDALSGLIVALFSRIRAEPEADVQADLRFRKILQILQTNPAVGDEESVIDALISQPLDAVTKVETQCGWTRPQSLSDLWTLLDFPTEAWTRGRRKRIMSSWKTWKLDIATQASLEPSYADAVLRLLARIMHQPTFYEKMEFEDLVYIASNMTQNDSGLLSLVEKLIDLTLKHVISNEDFAARYLDGASRYVEGLKSSKYSLSQMILVKGLTSALGSTPATKSVSGDIDLGRIPQKLRKMVEHSLSKFAGEAKSQAVVQGDGRLLQLQVTLSAVDCLCNSLPGKSIELKSEVVAQLAAAAKSYASEGKDVGWRLRKFLVTNYRDAYNVPLVIIWLEEPVDIRAEDSVYEFVEAFVKANDQAAKVRLLDELVQGGNLTSGSTSSLLTVKKVIEQQEQSTLSTNGNGETIDIAATHGQLAPLLTRTATTRHFNHLSAILLLLLDKHSNSATQFGIELTFNSVIDICSPQGPNLQDTRAAGQVYDRCYQLVATIIKRHRRRLEGHFPILIATLQAMLRVLLADPNSPQAHRHPQARSQHPPWLSSRLQARHAARFARLLTLICEPSAASVARSSTAAAAKAPQLDSATDAAKRAAGQDMFLVLETYIRLQLEADVPRDVRKALETGVYSVLNVTPQGCRRVLNESLDANGRALFRQMYADYKKFGRWSGV